MITRTIDEARALLASARSEAERLAGLRALCTVLERETSAECLEVAAELRMLARHMNDRDAEVQADVESSRLLRKLGRLGDAREVVETALHRCDARVEPLQTSLVLAELATALQSSEDGIEIARWKCETALELLDGLDDATGRAVRARVLGSYGHVLHHLGDYDQARAAYENALGLHLALQDERMAALLSINLVEVLQTIGEGSDELVDRLNAAGERATAALDSHTVAYAARVRSEVNLHAGRYDAALDAAHEALACAQRLAGEPRLLGSCYVQLGDVYLYLKEPERALDYYLQAESFSRMLGVWEYRAYALEGAGRAFADCGRFAEARQSLSDALAMYESRTMVEVTGCHASLGAVHKRMGDPEGAAEHFRRAMETAERFGLDGYRAAYQIEFILLCPVEELSLSERTEAIGLLLAAVEAPSQVRDNYASAHLRLAELYASAEKWHQAYLHAKRCQDIRERLNMEVTQAAVRQAERRHEAESREKLLALERAEAEAARLRAEALEREVEHKQRELAATAMSLAKQTELLGAFRNELRSIMRGNGDIIDIVRRIKAKLAELPCEAIDWTKFDAEFQELCPQFRSALHERHPELTKMEVKICSLLRLNLSSPEIARLMCKSERSIEWHRLNIRRKLDLTRDQDVTAALAAIG